MSFQSYMDNLETQTGKDPSQFVKLADANGIRMQPSR